MLPGNAQHLRSLGCVDDIYQPRVIRVHRRILSPSDHPHIPIDLVHPRGGIRSFLVCYCEPALIQPLPLELLPHTSLRIERGVAAKQPVHGPYSCQSQHGSHFMFGQALAPKPMGAPRSQLSG